VASALPTMATAAPMLIHRTSMACLLVLQERLG
jgi:hypothetical protein